MTPAIRRFRSSTSPVAPLSRHATYPPVHRCTMPTFSAQPPSSTPLLPLPGLPIAPERLPLRRPSAHSLSNSATPLSVDSPALPEISVALLLHCSSIARCQNRPWQSLRLHTVLLNDRMKSLPVAPSPLAPPALLPGLSPSLAVSRDQSAIAADRPSRGRRTLQKFW